MQGRWPGAFREIVAKWLLSIKARMRTCTNCLSSKPLSEYHLRGRSSKRTNQPYFQSTCKICSNSLKVIRKKLHKAHPEPSSSCQICGCTDRKLVLDHCHSTNSFRGWLCNGCNIGLGFLGDNVKSLERAISYLSSNSLSSKIACEAK